MALSLCDDTLLCNFPKCRAKLCGFAWVTACSHAFCDQHGSGEFSRSPAVCPACSSTLSGKLDIVRTELSPSEDYKAIVLAGLRPEVVLDISTRALAFWSYQIHQERMYQDYTLSRAEVQVKQLEKMLNQQNQSRELDLGAMRGEISSLKKVMEEYKRKYSEVAERLMERNRQYQKLQGLYDSLRLRNMVVVEREEPARHPHHLLHPAGPAGGFRPPCSPRPSPPFLAMGPQGEGSLFTGLELGRPSAFFHLRTPAMERGRAFPQDH
ncbi:E3 ubiquitin-protein ligase CCNB1IP1 [Gadus morhua]|uniref:Cyclin B1 interacting protein 1 n=1 Tax=Gadus morhua TaxID=8049 RepID=A0A8C4ZGM5_GADMO|nr:E3 ubiquitin-protein ligase CCNB1IP1 [Gadus morhua]